MKYDIVKNTTWRFRAISQAWKDCRSGRQVREDQEHKGKEQEEDPACSGTDRPCGRMSESLTSYQDESTQVLRSHPKLGAWPRQRGKYPWRIEQLVLLDKNTRGTWVLEAKTLSAIAWYTDLCVRKSVFKIVTVPRPHLPFRGRTTRRAAVKGDIDEILGCFNRWRETASRNARKSLASHQDEMIDSQRPWLDPKGWLSQLDGYSWRIEQLVHLGNNLRGTWVLEVKDMHALIREKGYVWQRSGSKKDILPQPPWPFPNNIRHNWVDEEGDSLTS